MVQSHIEIQNKESQYDLFYRNQNHSGRNDSACSLLFYFAAIRHGCEPTAIKESRSMTYVTAKEQRRIHGEAIKRRARLNIPWPRLSADKISNRVNVDGKKEVSESADN